MSLHQASRPVRAQSPPAQSGPEAGRQRLGRLAQRPVAVPQAGRAERRGACAGRSNRVAFVQKRRFIRESRRRRTAPRRRRRCAACGGGRIRGGPGDAAVKAPAISAPRSRTDSRSASALRATPSSASGHDLPPVEGLAAPQKALEAGGPRLREPWEPPRPGSGVREDKESRRILIFPPASEPANGLTRPDSQGILVFPFRTTPRPPGRRGRRVAAAARAGRGRPRPPGAPARPPVAPAGSAAGCASAGRPIRGSPAPERRGWS